MEITDKERIDFLESLNGEYTGKVVLRVSSRGRGFRLHETSRSDAGGQVSVRDAIDSYMRSRSDAH